ncbi:MAG: hypothetical protein R6V19_17160 [Armatimonadota bacterium]
MVDHKRVERIWREDVLKVRQHQPKRQCLWLDDGSCVRLRPQYESHVWSYDSVQDRTHHSRSLRLLSVIDEYTRQCVTIDLDRRRNSDRVLERLTDLFTRHEPPDASVRTRASATITDQSSGRKRCATGWWN